MRGTEPIGTRCVCRAARSCGARVPRACGPGCVPAGVLSAVRFRGVLYRGGSVPGGGSGDHDAPDRPRSTDPPRSPESPPAWRAAAASRGRCGVRDGGPGQWQAHGRLEDQPPARRRRLPLARYHDRSSVAVALTTQTDGRSPAPPPCPARRPHTVTVIVALVVSRRAWPCVCAVGVVRSGGCGGSGCRWAVLAGVWPARCGVRRGGVGAGGGAGVAGCGGLGGNGGRSGPGGRKGAVSGPFSSVRPLSSAGMRASPGCRSAAARRGGAGAAGPGRGRAARRGGAGRRGRGGGSGGSGGPGGVPGRAGPGDCRSVAAWMAGRRAGRVRAQSAWPVLPGAVCQKPRSALVPWGACPPGPDPPWSRGVRVPPAPIYGACGARAPDEAAGGPVRGRMDGRVRRAGQVVTGSALPRWPADGQAGRLPPEGQVR